MPNYRRIKDEPEETAWSFIREAQRRTALSTPNTGLIVTIDIGEPNDIHPKNKLDVGRANVPLGDGQAYDRSLSDSPVLKKSELKGTKILLTFENSGTGLKIARGDKLSEFAIAGADKKWVWAEAKIIGKNKVEVWSLPMSLHRSQFVMLSTAIRRVPT